MNTQPIRWDNIGGPSAAEASRPLELAQRSFNGLFDGLRDVVKERETVDTKNWEAGRQNNTNAFLDHLATYTKPEDLRAAIESGKLAQFKQQFGTQIDANAVRTAAEGRLTALMNNQKQGWEFDNALKDQNSHPFMDAYKTAAEKGDKLGMAAAEASYRQSGGRDLAALVKYANDTGWTKDQRGEEVKQWDRNARKFTDDLLTSKVSRDVAVRNADSNRISAEASRTSAGASVTNAETGKNRLNLDILRESGNVAQQEAETQAKITKELATVRGVSMTSQEGAEAIGKRIKELPPNLQAMAPDLLMKFNKQPGVTASTVINGLNMLQESYLKTNSGDVNAAYNAAIGNTVGSDQQEKLNKLRAGRLVEQSERSTATNDTIRRELDILRGVKPTTPAPATVPTSASAPAADTGTVPSPFDMPTPNVTPAAPPDSLQAAKDRLAAARAAGQGKGYYSPEMAEWRNAESAYNDLAKDRTSQVRDAQAKLTNSEQVVKSLEAQVRSWTKSNKGKEPPKALLDVLATHKSDLEVLRERAAEAKKLLTN